MEHTRKIACAFTLICLPALMYASADVQHQISASTVIGRSLDAPYKEDLSEQPLALQPVLPLTGANFTFKGQNGTSWGPLHLATAASGVGFGAQTRGGVDRLLPPAQVLFLIEHAIEVPGYVRSFNHDEANELSARAIAAFLVADKDMDEAHAQHFIEVVTKCMRTQESNQGGDLVYKTKEDKAFCLSVSKPPEAQLQGVIGSALLEKYTRVQAGRVLAKYIQTLSRANRAHLQAELSEHMAPDVIARIFSGDGAAK